MSLFDQQPTQELNPYPFQHDNIQCIRDGFAQGHRLQMFYASTGFGKTECMIYMMMLSAKKGKKSIMICDRRVLVNQTSERLDKYGVSHGVIMANHWRKDPNNLVQICSAQTIEAMGYIPEADIYFLDEAHCSRKKIIEYMMNNKARVLGCSASPFTKGLANIYTNVVGCTTTAELVDNHKKLSPLRVFVAKEIDMEGSKKVGGEWSDDETTKRGIQITGDVVATWAEKTHEIFGKPEKTIVFCAGVAHGKDLAEKFQAAGYNFISISYKDADNETTIKKFVSKDSDIIGIIACEILVKGFDCPEVMIGVDARPLSKSFSSHVQKLGRVMRVHPEKQYAVWIDHAGNYLRFLEKWEDLYYNGVSKLDDGAEKPMKEPTKEEKERAKCPKCGAFWETKTDTCTHCGFVRIRRNTVIETAGTVEELNAPKKKDKGGIDKYDFYAQLLGYAQQKGYKEGWAYHKTAEKYGTHPNRKVEPKQPSREVLSWITSRNIAYAHKKKFD